MQLSKEILLYGITGVFGYYACIARQDIILNGRSGDYRTPAPLLPKQVRYQAAPHSDI